MALTAATSNPGSLLTAIKKAIDEKKIETWAYDKDGDFTHTPDQWKNKAWFRPSIEQGRLRFGLLGPKGTVMSKLVYGVYHGRFVEMLLAHFDTNFTSATATAQADLGDSFTTG